MLLCDIFVYFQPRAKNVEGLTYADLDLKSDEKNHNEPPTPGVGVPPPPHSPWETRNSNGYEYAPIRNPWTTHPCSNRNQTSMQNHCNMDQIQ